VQHLKDIAQAARFEAMKPVVLRLAVPSNDPAIDLGTRDFQRASYWAAMARECRMRKQAACATPSGIFPPSYWEARARSAERTVREIALHAEILLARGGDQLPSGPCHQPMLNILMGAAA